jgi:hypothetical protein
MEAFHTTLACAPLRWLAATCDAASVWARCKLQGASQLIHNSCRAPFAAEFKGAKKMAHRRPKKRTPADRRHGPAQYPAPPAPPAEYSVISQ